MDAILNTFGSILPWLFVFALVIVLVLAWMIRDRLTYIELRFREFRFRMGLDDQDHAKHIDGDQSGGISPRL